MRTGRRELHADFTEPDPAGAADRAAFLTAVDRLPGLVEVRAALRQACPSAAGSVLLDAGCGLGLETRRLAEQRPGTTVIGLDRDPAILALAGPETANLRWRQGDVTALEDTAWDPPRESVDVVRTERVLMYVENLTQALRSIAGALRPGGVFAGFELDYGATLLPVLGRPAASVRRWAAALESALPQPWAGRLLAEECAGAGLAVTEVRPFSFVVDHVVWSRIVADALRAAAGTDDGAHGLSDWLDELDRPDPAPGFRAVFGGIMTVARR